MKKFLFAVAVGLLSAIPVSADEPQPTPAPTPTPVATATTTSSGVIYSGSTTSTPRRGLFGRLRSRMGRDNAAVTTTPYSGTVITTPAPTTGSVPSIPTPMPSTGGTTGGVTRSADGVVTASGTTTTTMMPMTPTTTTSTRMYGERMGLIARLRARR